MAPEIERITNTFLSNPAKIEVARAATTNVNIKQGVLMFRGSSKPKEPAEKRAVLRALIEAEGDGCSNAIIFCNRKSDVDIVAKSLNKNGYDAAPIHGDLDQSHRTRTLESFRENKLRFLVASDVAARGLDIPAVTHVFNFDVPSHAEDYVHRIGRTGRAGRSGTAIMICIGRDEKNLEDVERLVQSEIPRLENPLAAPKAPQATVSSDEKPAEEKRTRSRTRKPREDKQQQPAVAEATAPAQPTVVETEQAPTPQQDTKPHDGQKRENHKRGDRKNDDRKRDDHKRQDRKPDDTTADDRKQRDEKQQQDRGNRGRNNDRGRNDSKVVGLGDDTPAFIAKSFIERAKG
jgi:superfamily II DNA/RNA helicase